METAKKDDWTTLELKTLKELKTRGWSNASIARRLGRTKGAVAFRWSSMGVQREYKQKAVEQLCAYCINAVPDPVNGHGCNWSRRFQPVPGWKATPTTVKHKEGQCIHSYHITKCPEFKEG